MKKPRFAWNDEAIALAWKIVHFQDMQIGGLGLCLNIIETQEYNDFQKYLWVVEYTTRNLEDTARQLYGLGEGKEGRPPKWHELADRAVILALRVKKLFPIARKEKRAGQWTIIETRLRVCCDEIKKLQTQFINSLPETTTTETYISQRSVAELLDLVKTLEMTEGGSGGRWRRND